MWPEMQKRIDNKRHRSIQDDDWLYNLLSPLVQYGCRCHYDGFVVRGSEHLPQDAPYIIAPCHQQALMEPLAVLCFAPKPPVFLARADLFRKSALRRALTFLKIMPVYRIRDGIETLDRNQAIFDRCREVLLDGTPLCLMAEGRHNNRHHLLPLGKGMFRIAGETQLALAGRPLYIVPTGIDFDDYERPYSNLVVNIGQPIAVRPYMDTYRTNEPLALNQMRDALSAALMPLMHDVRHEERYDDIMTLCHVLNRPLRRQQRMADSAWNRFRVRQQVAQRMDALAEADRAAFLRLADAAAALRDRCRRLGLRSQVLSEHWPWVPTLVLALAVLLGVVLLVGWRPLRMVALFALLCYPLPLLPTHRLIRRRVADTQFRSSFNWGVRFFGSLAYVLVAAVALAVAGCGWMDSLTGLRLGGWWGAVAVAWAFVAARLTAPVATLLRRTADSLHYWLLRLTRRRPLRDAERLRDEIFQQLMS